MTVLDVEGDRLSLAQKIAMLPPEMREQAMAGLDPEQLLHQWSFWARPAQLQPDGTFSTWLYLAGRGSGKALSLDTPIPTPDGWVAMGDLTVGDKVFDEAGQICHVTAVYDSPCPNHGAWRLEFSDGSFLLADGDHQWVTWTHRDRKEYLRYATRDGYSPTEFPQDWVTWKGLGTVGPKVRTTGEVIATLTQGKRGDRNHCVPVAGPLVLPEAALPIDPYLFGYWLGDGGHRNGELFVGDEDLAHIEEQIALAGEPSSSRRLPTVWRVSLADSRKSAKRSLSLEQMHKIREAKGHIYAKDLAVMYGVTESVVYGIWERDTWMRTIAHEETFTGRLRALGVIRNKHIPTVYLRASLQQRMALLQGLMDSDGYVAINGRYLEFTTIHERFANDVLELIRSLSERPTKSKGKAILQGVDCGPKYRITWCPTRTIPFRLPRKRDRVRPVGGQGLRLRHRMIVGATRVADQPMRCITVDSPNSMYLAGEAMIPTHNTRAASEWIHQRVADGYAKRILLLGRTAADVRDVMLHGESGLLNTGPPNQRPEYAPSKRLVTWPNGAEALCISADEPDQARGPQADTAWCDEYATFPGITGADGATAFDNLRMGLRLPVDGDAPRMIITTTPRRTPAMFKLLEEAKDPKFGIVITRGTTYENLGNLAESFRNTIIGLYEGTRLGRQELLGEMLTDIEGALFLQEWFDDYRVTELPPGRMYGVVGVDPSVAERPGDECGIVVVKATMEKDFYRRHLYVVEDASVKGSPSVWAKRVAYMARKWDAPIVAEGNQGGELVRMAIAQADSNLPVHIVHAKTGKATRAEPVAALFEQGRGHMVGWHSALEDQSSNWIPAESRYSPDHLDALTWACLSLTTRQKGISFALGRHLRARSSRGRLPQINASALAMKSRRR